MCNDTRQFLRDVPLTPEEMQPVAVAHLGLHSHTCTECGRECACYRVPCPARGRGTQLGDRRVWRCGGSGVCTYKPPATKENEAAA